MATAAQCFRFIARRSPLRIAAHTRAARSIESPRNFALSSARRKKAEPVKEEDEEEDLDEAEIAKLEAEVMSSSTATAVEPGDPKKAFDQLVQKFSHTISRNTPRELKKYPFKEPRLAKPKPGLLNMGEKINDSVDYPEDDPEFEEDDISSLAHGELDQHREFRHYARLAAWEMPLLTSKFRALNQRRRG